MKRLISFIIVINIVLGANVFAADAIKLEDVIKQGIENSKKLKISQFNIEEAQGIYDDAVKAADDIDINHLENLYWYQADPDKALLTTNRKNKELLPEQKKYELSVSDKTKKVDEESLKIDIYEAYFAVVKSIKDIEYKKELVSLSNIQEKNALAKYKKGLISKNDYTLVKLTKKDASSQLFLSQRSQKRLLMALYTLMGEGYHPDIKQLEVSLNYTDMKGVDQEVAIQKALKNRLEIYVANENIRLKELEQDIVEKYYKSNDNEYKDAGNSVEEAKLNLETKKTDIEYEIRTAYNNLLNLLDTIEINKSEVTKNEINSNVINLKYKLGMAIKQEVEEAKTNLDKANITLNNSIYDYIIERQKFEVAQGIGPAIQ